MKDLFMYFIHPVFISILLLLLGVFFRFNRKKKNAWLSFSLAAVLFFSVSTSFLPNYLIRQLEITYPVCEPGQLTLSDEPIPIIVLGAGYGHNEALPPLNRLNTTTLGRLVEAVRIYQQLPNAKVAGSAGLIYQKISQAQAIAEGALALGVSPSDTLQIRGALNTWEEAGKCAARFGKGSRVVIATDAIHMPRAMMLFEAKGLQPIAAPTNHLIKTEISLTLFDFLPSTASLRKTELVMHEYLGMLWAKWVLL
ncbi:ElyC/SanA/YdcF family protein [Imperialibacter roseus]|uniref:ElyC/SanA/YdcF family protein n=1 Tax=Imperialibacter roseus TaxID=1324217 RepID=A0ABZ0ILG2_9BACT|nr:ElyC/SanA/YdcF family protein [Imperialibacter roseus]WOK05352.1 ElyC/SanA/YdcF family protein [Imperialibacter roseus]